MLIRTECRWTNSWCIEKMFEVNVHNKMLGTVTQSFICRFQDNSSVIIDKTCLSPAHFDEIKSGLPIDAMKNLSDNFCLLKEKPSKNSCRKSWCIWLTTGNDWKMNTRPQKKNCRRVLDEDEWKQSHHEYGPQSKEIVWSVVETVQCVYYILWRNSVYSEKLTVLLDLHTDICLHFVIQGPYAQNF